MYYLTHLDEQGHKLIDFGNNYEPLAAQVSDRKNKNAACKAFIFNDKALRAAFLVDGFGIAQLDEGNYLIPLADL